MLNVEDAKKLLSQLNLSEDDLFDFMLWVIQEQFDGQYLDEGGDRHTGFVNAEGVLDSY